MLFLAIVLLFGLALLFWGLSTRLGSQPAPGELGEEVSSAAPVISSSTVPATERSGLKTVILSDFAGAKLEEARAARMAPYKARLAAYEAARAAKHRRVQEARLRLSETLAWTAWRDYLSAITARLPPIPTPQGPDLAEKKWQAGHEGESAVDDFLKKSLGAEWTLIAGYKNRKGEIDRILVGPRGAYAIEIKHLGGTIHCDGDTWWRDRHGRGCRVVEAGITIADNGGRGPSRQLNEPVRMLQHFLSRKGVHTRIRRGIIFSHDRAFLGKLNAPTVDFVVTLEWLNLETLFGGVEQELAPDACAAAVGLIRRDHQHYARPTKRHHNHHQCKANRASAPSP
jgi:hypothetical protein